jgi:glycosyltransferase involved in cell wall biosynthesis
MISIIIPAHNEFENLQRLFKIAGFLNHEKLLEIIVAISPNNSDKIEMLEGSSKIHIIRCTNKGRAAQMNEAAKFALGDTFVFLHADVVPPKGFVQNILNSLQNGYDAGFFFISVR